MRKPVTITIAAAAAAIAAVTGVAAAGASPATRAAASGTEDMQVMSATAGPASVIARGVFTAAGRARLSDARTATITFPGGTVVLSHRQAHGSQHFYPASCLSLVSQSGSYQITHGTGRYAGISGHGTYQLSLEMIGARVHGQCSPGRPLAQQELLRLSGPARL